LAFAAARARLVSVRVTFLGSGDAFGSGGRFQTCILLESGGTRVLLDCGASSLVAMRRFDVDPQSVEAVALSHLHGDHFGGLPFLVLDAQFRRRDRRLTIVGPPGVEARVGATMDVLFPGSAAVARRFETRFVELVDRRPTTLGPFTLTPFAVVHASGAPPFALRVACGGRIVTYSGDTEWTDSLLEASADADLFVCEAYSFDKRIRYHLDYRTLAAQRTRLTCRRLVLTHMSEDMLGRVGELDVEAAADGRTIEL
jgi:ribonuclease BN (tRNA processing enzyme)